jgi:hypothetical protein
MTRATMVGWAALVAGLVVAAVRGGFGGRGTAAALPLPPECAGHTCLTVDGDDDVQAVAVRDGELGATRVASCTVVVRRPNYEATIRMVLGDVGMTDGAIVQLVACHSEPDPPSSRPHARAVLLVNPAPLAWATPAAGNVFVPYESDPDAIVDHRYVAHAAKPVDELGRPVPGDVSLVVGEVFQRGKVIAGLRVGDTFSWGPHQARIVRVVPPDGRITGWVEVALRP